MRNFGEPWETKREDPYKIKGQGLVIFWGLDSRARKQLGNTLVE